MASSSGLKAPSIVIAMAGSMTVYLLVLFLAGQKIESDSKYPAKDDCIADGKMITQVYKDHHPHSQAWFWCYPERVY